MNRLIGVVTKLEEELKTQVSWRPIEAKNIILYYLFQ